MQYTPDGRKLWGFEITPTIQGPDTLKWFKLLLQEKPFEKHRPVLEEDMLLDGLDISCRIEVNPALNTAKKLKKLNIEPVTVVTDFLGKVREVTLNSIERTYDVQWVRSCKILYVLTGNISHLHLLSVRMLTYMSQYRRCGAIPQRILW